MRYLPLAILALMLLASIFFYNQVPEEMPVHWNTEGHADAYSSRFRGLFMLPIIAIGIYMLMILLPRFSSVATFKKHYELFIAGFMMFFFLLHTAIIMYSMIPFNFTYLIIPLLSAFLYLTGYILKYCKRNHFMGIRTPWTLASEQVWDKTHKLGSFVFRIIPFALLFGLIIPGAFLFLLFGSLILNILFFTIYSYVEYRHEQKDKHKTAKAISQLQTLKKLHTKRK